MPLIKKELVDSGKPRPRPRPKGYTSPEKSSQGTSRLTRSYAQVAATPSPPRRSVSTSKTIQDRDLTPGERYAHRFFPYLSLIYPLASWS
jgi:hypothetical protein